MSKNETHTSAAQGWFSPSTKGNPGLIQEVMVYQWGAPVKSVPDSCCRNMQVSCWRWFSKFPRFLSAQRSRQLSCCWAIALLLPLQHSRCMNALIVMGDTTALLATLVEQQLLWPCRHHLMLLLMEKTSMWGEWNCISLDSSILNGFYLNKEFSQFSELWKNEVSNEV